MIVGLMALGAGVRTMNAGLSCPDWPLCFGKVIPDFHVGVWFEFVHRAYAGVVAILYAIALVIAFRSDEVPKSTKTAAKWGVLFLTAQIVMGGLTVLLLVKAVVVTTHLLLATLFLSCVVWMLFGVHKSVRENAPERRRAENESLRRWKQILAPFAWILPTLVFLQIAIGGLVASTYSGSVCVDWPLCNGQWVPTWRGAIGLQIIHRFFAYALVSLFLGLAVVAFRQRHVMPSKFVQMSYWGGAVVLLQTVVGIMNLIYFIPPHLTVLHQTLAMALLIVTLKMTFDVRSLENPSAAPETLSRTPEFSRS